VPAGSPPTPPQTRTSTINASGSLKRGICSRRHHSTKAGKRPAGRSSRTVCPHEGSLSPVAPFATRRLPPMGYPAFKRYYEVTTTAALAPPASVPLACGFSRCFLDFAHVNSRKPAPRAWTLMSRCRPCPAVKRKSRAALPAFQDTPICLCPALRPRPGPRTLGLRPLMVATYCVHGDAVPPTQNRKTQTIHRISGFNYAALALAPYASCDPYGCATQCSLPSGCQPLSGGSVYPLGIGNRFHPSFVGFLLFCLLARLCLCASVVHVWVWGLPNQVWHQAGSQTGNVESRKAGGTRALCAPVISNRIMVTKSCGNPA
jgi:hypothetical protein